MKPVLEIGCCRAKRRSSLKTLVFPPLKGRKTKNNDEPQQDVCNQPPVACSPPRLFTYALTTIGR